MACPECGGEQFGSRIDNGEIIRVCRGTDDMGCSFTWSKDDDHLYLGEELSESCPFCGEDITVYIGRKCGNEPNGSVSINHTCDSGLSVEWYESDSQDPKEAIEALRLRV
jgi:hypothetical protein